MKLAYQQMLSFFSVILITLVVTGLSFIQYITKSLYNTTYTQLANYANIVQNVFIANNSSDADTIRFLQDSETILHDQYVNFVVFDENNNVVYPTDFKTHLNKSYWHDLQENKTIKLRLLPQKNTVTREKEDQIAIIKPIFYQNKLRAAIYVGSAIANIRTSIQRIENNLLISLVVSGVIAVIMSYFLSRITVLRINRLREATHKIAKGNYDVYLQSKNHDELDSLVDDFNSMSKALAASRKEIKRQEEQRRQFLMNAAHEMRTPLTTINGLLEGLVYDAIPEESRAKSIQLMRNETKRLIRLVNDNLDYEKIRTNQIPLHEKEFNATEALSNIVSQLDNKVKDVHDTMTLKADKEVKVYADYDRFVQIMFNIMQNAVQFTTNGKIIVTAQRGDHRAIFTVSDTGIGMTPEEMRNIWERYYKADPSRKNTKYGESGLGMAIVRQLIEQHHAQIDVASQKGKGTRFTVIFSDKGYPLSSDDNKDADDE
ncbi:MAG: HAMP domain-containing histidine kinase [Candidatus Paralactobacillus gallistercoris]|uniref:histidine kinase n=1 Tax=Candidatus Paralactobacillus gallistercoris TaxID=2838724 RepID=A0A948X3N4_9LACO|nr:HAMP domain-containing histidine kinase [Candidatus Paralactobacillus gallistercoris]